MRDKSGTAKLVSTVSKVLPLSAKFKRENKRTTRMLAFFGLVMMIWMAWLSWLLPRLQNYTEKRTNKMIDVMQRRFRQTVDDPNLMQKIQTISTAALETIKNKFQTDPAIQKIIQDKTAAMMSTVKGKGNEILAHAEGRINALIAAAPGRLINNLSKELSGEGGDRLMNSLKPRGSELLQHFLNDEIAYCTFYARAYMALGGRTIMEPSYVHNRMTVPLAPPREVSATCGNIYDDMMDAKASA